MGRTPDQPAQRHTLADALDAAAEIRRLRTTAGDPDLDFLPVHLVDDQDVDAVVRYTETHRNVGPSVRAAELEHRALLVEYQRQRDTERCERSLLSVLRTAHQLGVPAAGYGKPAGLPYRQAVYGRRVLLERKYPAGDQAGDEGRARQWLDEHATTVRALAETLVDHRDTLAGLVAPGPARTELLRWVDQVGVAMGTRRMTQELCTAVAMAVSLLRVPPARPAADPAHREQLAAGARLLW